MNPYQSSGSQTIPSERRELFPNAKLGAAISIAGQAVVIVFKKWGSLSIEVVLAVGFWALMAIVVYLFPKVGGILVGGVAVLVLGGVSWLNVELIQTMAIKRDILWMVMLWVWNIPLLMAAGFSFAAFWSARCLGQRKG